MKIKVVFLGRVSEIAGRYTTTIELTDNSSLKDLFKILGEKLIHDYIRDLLKDIMYS